MTWKIWITRSTDENGENVPHLEITEVVLVYCNVVSNDYQHGLALLYAFVPNKSFDQLLHISSLYFIVFIYWSMVYWSKF